MVWQGVTRDLGLKWGGGGGASTLGHHEYFLLACSIFFLLNPGNNEMVIIVMDEFFKTTFFFFVFTIHISITPWKLPIVKNHYFVKNVVLTKVIIFKMVSFNNATWSLTLIRESLLSHPKTFTVLFIRFVLAFKCSYGWGYILRLKLEKNFLVMAVWIQWNSWVGYYIVLKSKD